MVVEYGLGGDRLIRVVLVISVMMVRNRCNDGGRVSVMVRFVLLVSKFI